MRDISCFNMIVKYELNENEKSGDFVESWIWVYVSFFNNSREMRCKFCVIEGV